MYKNMLPLGSVVRLKEAEVNVMIIGRVIVNGNDSQIYDYVSCVYPIGIAGQNEMVFFNRDAIELVKFIGFQDEEELSFRSEVLDQLGEVELVNGQLVSKEENKDNGGNQ